MADLVESITQEALTRLPAYGFQDVSGSTTCKEFRTRLTALLTELCRPFVTNLNAEITRQRSVGENGEANATSWSISETKEVWRLAAPKFANRIALQETLQLGSNSIRCETAALYLSWLREEWENSIIVRMQARDAKKLSEKHKRKWYHWTPYGPDPNPLYRRRA